LNKIYVLRLGHRPERDKRITTHVALVARAFGANGFILASVVDNKILESIRKVLDKWGGLMHIEMGVDPYEYVREWKSNGGLIVHLTMYGLHIDNVIDKIRDSGRDILIIVGAEKVPRFFYNIADWNIAITNQPHSEVAALAIFLDKFFMGEELNKNFENPEVKIIPQEKGKKLIKLK